MQRNCAISGRHFEITGDDLAFLEKLAPSVAGKRYALPPPNLCPEERRRRRLAFRNERRLYQRPCSHSGKTIVSAFSPDKPFPVFSKEVFWSDAWDARDYGRDIDWSRPFFEQFAELSLATPRLTLICSPDSDENNCGFVNFSGNSRNCYMTFDSDFNEDCMYSNVLKHSRNCVDCSYVNGSELCYECLDCSKCYNLLYSQNCTSCVDSFFLYSCIGCTNCYGCYNLQQKQYWIFNKPVGKEAYLRFISEQKLGSRSFLAQEKLRFQQMLENAPRKYCRNLKIENCTGDHIENAKNCHFCFNIGEGEDLRYCDSLYSAKDCMDVSSFGEKIERVYSSGTIGIACSNIWFGQICVSSCSDLMYCMEARMSKNCFGCISPKNHSYCILNKQYSPEEYARTVERLIHHMQETGEWGEFFPMSLSNFGYNETMAQEYYPITKEEALQLGAQWSSFEPPAPKVPRMAAGETPDTIHSVDERILMQALVGSSYSRPYRITSTELQYYQRHNLPIPNEHPDVRHTRRMSERNPLALWERTCAKTGETILSSYAPARPETVLGENAFAESMI